MYDYSPKEWKKFSKTEKKIIVLIKKYKIEDKEKIREMLGWPLEPIHKKTFNGHWTRLMKKVEEIRRLRNEPPLSTNSQD